jgi:predicted lipid-binding transport protein (Tim44 family)
MKNYVVGLMLAVTALTMVAEATARPLGGGRSIGRQSPTVARQAPAPAAQKPATAPAAAPAAAPSAAPAAPIPPKPGIPWKGIIGGALLGAGVAALFSSMGMGGLGAAMGNIIGPMLMILLLCGAAYFIYSMFRRKQAPAEQSYAGFAGQQPAAGGTPEIGSRIEPAAFQPVQAPASTAAAAPAAPWGVPADFDTTAFLRHAKSSFIRMQAAWDKADVNDLREFTTPEVYAELKMQIQERGATADYTDVVSIDAELLGIETIGEEYLASVKFDGMIKSAPTAAAEPFAEVWNMAKPVKGSGGWVLAGIQQLS